MNPTPHRQTRRRRIAVIAATLGAALALAYAALIWLASSIFDARRTPPTPAALASWLRIDLPPGLSEYRSHAEGFQDQIVHVRFRMPTGEVGAFVEGNRLERSTAPFDPAAVPGLDWWKPTRVLVTGGSTYQVPMAPNGPRIATAVLIVPTGAASADVYIVAHDF